MLKCLRVSYPGEVKEPLAHEELRQCKADQVLSCWTTHIKPTCLPPSVSIKFLLVPYTTVCWPWAVF